MKCTENSEKKIQVDVRGACHYARPTGQRPAEFTKGKWNDIVRWKQNFRPDRLKVFHLPFDRNFDFFSVKYDWKRECLKKERQFLVRLDRAVKEEYL